MVYMSATQFTYRPSPKSSAAINRLSANLGLTKQGALEHIVTEWHSRKLTASLKENDKLADMELLRNKVDAINERVDRLLEKLEISRL